MGNSVTRRGLVKGAAFAGVLAITGGLAAGGIPSALAADEEDVFAAANTSADEGASASTGVNADDTTGADSSKQYGFWVNTANCVACFTCVETCRKVNRTPSDRDRLAFYRIDNGAGEVRMFLSGCQHCDDPACATVCPAHAITKGAGGIVTVDKNRCIGCKYCYQACPFSVPKYTSRGMDKCDFCHEVGVELGQPTNCVRACPHDALHCGPIDELMVLAENAAQSIECSTGPNYLYS